MCTVAPPPFSPVEPVVDVLHGVSVTDPYRWLEDQNSPRTRSWIEEQTRYARAYLDRIPGREDTRRRVGELLDVETYDSLLKSGTRYFFRKRIAGQEQPCIYFREGSRGEDQLLVDPSERGTGNHTAVKPLRISRDGNLLLYEVKQGGERAGTFEILDVANRRTLPDSLPRGYLRGFAFAPDGKGFYYSHEVTGVETTFHRVVNHHVLGTTFEKDRTIFCAGRGKHVRVTIIPGRGQVGLLVSRLLDKTHTDFLIWRVGGAERPVPVLCDVDYSFAPRFLGGRILALTNLESPNRRVVEVQPRKKKNPLFFNLVNESDAAIRDWLVSRNHIFVSYNRGATTQVDVFDSYGKPLGHIPCDPANTLRLLADDPENDEILFERESFTSPAEQVCYYASSGESTVWGRRTVPFDKDSYTHTQVSFRSKDGTGIPMFLVGRRDVLTGGPHPTIMTSYGGFGISMTPQFSVLVALLMERGCLFALPNIRGGSEFGSEWHRAAKRQKRQTAYDDFLAAAKWLIKTGRTRAQKLAVFGGSNSGLLVAAAMTQRPDLFRAVLCMVPLLDMLRYHLFDDSFVWKEEFGSADDPNDFAALIRYSPYHQVRAGTAYPAVMLVTGDSDQNSNPLHARKMTSRLQAATVSRYPILLDYSKFRGHSPVLPLRERIAALADRVAFLLGELGILS
jgi:prolyl oligopeptidase